MQYRNFIIGLLSLTLSSSTALAVVVDELYQAEIVVVDPTELNSEHQLRAALRAVLVKLTGKSQVESIYGVNQILEQAKDFVAQYEYRRNSNNIQEKQSLIIEPTLWVRFDQKTLDPVLQDYAISLWSQERPLTLTWLVIDNGNGLRRFAHSDEDLGLLDAMNKIATQRGIQLMSTLNDLVDTSSLKPADISGGFSDIIKMASERYQHDAILTAVLQQQSADHWSGKWTSYIDETEQSWSLHAESLAAVLNAGVNGHSDRLANRYAQKKSYGAVTELEITVKDINNFSDYIRCLSYLESLNFIIDIRVTQFELGRVLFDLQIRGGRENLNQALTFSQVMRLEEQGYHYRLMPR